MKKFIKLIPIMTFMSMTYPSFASNIDSNSPTTIHQTNDWQPVVVSNSKQTIIHSKHTNKEYLIQVATIGNKPANGYPVVYVLDGNVFFNAAKSIGDLAWFQPNQTQQKSLMIVGIGYQTDQPLDLQKRAHDLTPKSEKYNIPANRQSMAFGGAEEFNQFLQEELKPILLQNYPINLNKQSLFGHSYGGLFALYDLFNHQNYQNYFIASPSIWWNDQRIMQDLPNLKPKSVQTVLLTYGGLETKDEALKNKNQYTSEIWKLSQTLETKMPNTKVMYDYNLNQTHGMNAYPSLMRAINIAYKDCMTDSGC